MNWTHKYVGVPFRSQGRDARGCDCWGLVRLIYWLELQIELPLYGEISATDLIAVSNNITEGYQREQWHSVEQPHEFDVAVMRYYGKKQVGHVGVMVSQNELIHTERGFDAAIVPLTHMTIRNRIVGFRRHEEVLLTNERKATYSLS